MKISWNRGPGRIAPDDGVGYLRCGDLMDNVEQSDTLWLRTGERDAVA